MNREILFRGKRVDNGEWVEGDLLTPTDIIDCTEIAKNTGMGDRYDVDPESVGQYTGLTDRNGRKIFEGDVLEAINGNKGYVLFENGAFMKLSNNEDIPFSIAADINEVIGNIHDNPELLVGER